MDQREPLRAVLFDLDGTLYPLPALRIRFALRYPWHVRTMLALARAREELRREGLVRSDFWEEVQRRAADQLGCTPAEAGRLRERIMEQEWPAVLRKVGPHPGTRPLLEQLVERGLAIGVLSDYPVTRKLEALGLADLPWRVLLDASAGGALKPHPVPFLQALELLGLPPGQVLYVGDRLDTDVEGARQAGLIPLLLRVRRGSPPPPPLLSCRTPAELWTLLQQTVVAEQVQGGRA